MIDGVLRFHYGEEVNGHFDPLLMYTYQGTSGNDDRLHIDATANPYIRLDVGMTHSSDTPMPLAFHFWQTDGAIGRVDFSIQPNAGTKVHLIDMRETVQVSGDAAWSGTEGIRALRLDTAQSGDATALAGSELQVDRIVLTDGESDADDDGLADKDELDAGTDPGDGDTDDDGLPDGWEVENDLDPLDDGSGDVNNGADGDPDDDDVSNLDEYNDGSDPQDGNDPHGPQAYHSADTDSDGALSLEEMLGVVRLYHAGAYHCGGASVYLPGEGDTTCAPHDADFQPADWRIELPELMRVVQLHNAGAYHACAELDAEDGFCLGAAAG